MKEANNHREVNRIVRREPSGGFVARHFLVGLLLGLFCTCRLCAADSLSMLSGCTNLSLVAGAKHSVVLSNKDLTAKVDVSETPFAFQKKEGSTAVFVLPHLASHASEAKSVTFSAAFFDVRSNLIVAVSQEWPRLEPKESLDLGSCAKRLPLWALQRIVSCKIGILIGPPRSSDFVLEGDSVEDE